MGLHGRDRSRLATTVARALAALLLAAAFSALAPPRAHAALVGVATDSVDYSGSPEPIGRLFLRAGSHRFDGRLTVSGSAYTFTSNGGAIHVRSGCRRVTAVRAVCHRTQEAPIGRLRVRLSRHDDRFRVAGDRLDYRFADFDSVRIGGGGGDDPLAWE